MAAAVMSCSPVAAAFEPVAPSLGVLTLLRCQAALGLRAFETGTGRCDATHACVGLFVHVVVEDGEPVRPPQWFAAQVAAANRLYADIGVAFEVAGVREAPADQADIDGRSDRDALGRDATPAGVVHVFVVRRLADVDIAGDEIRGVHWRVRAEPSRRFVILSSIAPERVLAHELGHFFGLPHSRFAVSIMNKTPRDEPPPELRGFHPSELAIMRRERDRMFGDRTLVRRNRRSPRR
ncbi:MAG: matrixin family metalloprotease [Deltaproteobacteria bacterium]|nr:matrixin family metalloprotease [Deltaproteobacteria bacterium]MBK8718955.1 matrixin family metalloprotease [Deltaproteobacteria bacterium]